VLIVQKDFRLPIRTLVKVGRSRLWAKKEIPDERCGMGFRNAEKPIRRAARAGSRVFLLRPQLS